MATHHTDTGRDSLTATGPSAQEYYVVYYRLLFDLFEATLFVSSVTVVMPLGQPEGLLHSFEDYRQCG